MSFFFVQYSSNCIVLSLWVDGIVTMFYVVIGFLPLLVALMSFIISTVGFYKFVDHDSPHTHPAGPDGAGESVPVLFHPSLMKGGRGGG